MLFLKKVFLLCALFELASCGETAPTLLRGIGGKDRSLQEAGVSVVVPVPEAIKQDTSITFSSDRFTDIKVEGTIDSSTNIVSVTAADGTVTLQQTTGLTLSEGTGSGDAIVSFSGTTTDVNAALDGISFTPTAGFLGYASVTVTVTDTVSTTSSSAVVQFLVNEAIDETATLDMLLDGVTKIHSGQQPGMMVAYGPTALNVMMFPGDKEGPMAVASTFGAGKVIAMPDHQMLRMTAYGADSGDWYRNTIDWLSGSPHDLGVKIVTLEDQVSDWLIAEGYTDVVKTSSGDLLTNLDGATVFIGGWMGTSEPDENIEGLKSFAAAGGGILVCEYGRGYEVWWKTSSSPAAKLLSDTGIGFRSQWMTWFTGTIDATNRANVQVTGDDLVLALQDSPDISADERSYALGYFWKAINDVLGDDHPIMKRADVFFAQKIADINPTPTAKVSDSISKALLNRERDVLKKTPASQVVAHRLASLYGDIPADAPRITKTVDIDTNRNRWQATGLYAVPGELVTVTVPAVMVGKGIRVRINAHTDDINKRGSWERPPVVHRYFTIDSEIVEVACGFGGAIFIDLQGDRFSDPKVNAGVQQVTISNAIEHPYFDAAIHTDEDWISSLKNKPAPYGVMVTADKNFMLCQRTAEFAALDKPTALMTFWQAAAEQQDWLAGYLKPRLGGEFANVDIQISAGAGHSGYPYQGYDKHWGNLANYDKLSTEGSWGDFHELGHNHQRGWWTFGSDGEISNNIFSAYNMRQLTPDSASGWAKKVVRPINIFEKALAAANKDGGYEKSGGDRLLFWIHLADVFGFETLRNVYMTYEQDNIDKNPLPSGTAEEKDEFYKRFSVVSGFDMTKYMVDAWGLEVSQAAKDHVANLALPAWLPALGAMSSAAAKMNEPVKIDLVANLLSYDGSATIVAVTDAYQGTVTVNVEGEYVYTPNTGMLGRDKFSYTVESSTGYQITTDITVDVYTLGDGEFEVTFPTNSGWSGKYIQSTDPVDVSNGQPIWFENGKRSYDGHHFMLFYCLHYDKWALTTNYWKTNVNVNNENGSNCAGYAKTLSGSSDGSKNPWMYTWDVADPPVFEISPASNNTYEFYYDEDESN